MSPEVARTGHGRMSDLSPLSGEQRKSNFGPARSVDDPRRTSPLGILSRPWAISPHGPKMLGWISNRTGRSHEAARVHHAGRRRGGGDVNEATKRAASSA